MFCRKVLSTFSLYLGTNEGVADFGFQCFKRYPLELSSANILISRTQILVLFAELWAFWWAWAMSF